MDLSSSLWISSCIGIELLISASGEVTFNGARISVDGKALTFEKKVTGLASLDAVRSAFPGEPYAALVISGKGVLHKKIAMVESVDASTMAQLLPNANHADFYIQNFTSASSSFVSLIRKSEADIWLSRFSSVGFKILSLSFGPFPAEQVILQLNVDQREAVFGGYHIQRDENGNWLSWSTNVESRSAFPVKVEAELLGEDLIVAYGAAFQLLYYHKLDVIEADITVLEEERKQLSGNKKLRAVSLAALIIFFLLLVVNFLAFYQYSSLTEKLSLKSRNSSQEQEQAQARLSDLSAKVALLDSLGYNGGLNEAKLIDQLANGLPQGLSWKRLLINPMDEARSRNEKRTSFLDHKIILQGDCEEVRAVNAWLEGARKLSWVKTALLENYSVSQESGKGEFLISINY